MKAAKSWRKSAAFATASRECLNGVTRGLVLAALQSAIAPLPIATVATLAGISYHRAWRALETLVAMKVAVASGPKNNLRFALKETAAGLMTGGPASASAAEAAAGLPTSAARPGRAA